MPIGQETENRIIDEASKKAIEESQSQSRSTGPRQGFGEWFASNFKLMLTTIGLVIGTNGIQGAAVSLPNINQAKEADAYASAATNALRMSSANWVAEIASARADERADCDAQKQTLNEHWQWRMDNHVH